MSNWCPHTASVWQRNAEVRNSYMALNAASVSSAATMATICQKWRPDRGRCFKTYGLVLVLFMDLVFQCVNGGVYRGDKAGLHVYER